MTKDFAVVKLNSRQYVVEEGSTFEVDRISKGTPIEVLLAQIKGKSFVGEPSTTEVGVEIELLEDKKGKKIGVRRYKSKSRYRKNKGHRQPISVIRIAEIKKGSKSVIKEVSKPKTEDKPLDITDSIKEKLAGAGYKDISDLKGVSKEELTSIKGIGEKAAEKILDSIK